MNTENIIMIGVTLAIVAVVAYFFYTKLQSQQALIEHLTKKCDDMELMFNPRAHPQELASVYSRRQPQPQPQPQPQMETMAEVHEQPEEKCADALCELRPMRVETNDEELENIVSSEIDMVLKKKESPRLSSPKRRK